MSTPRRRLPPREFVPLLSSNFPKSSSLSPLVDFAGRSLPPPTQRGAQNRSQSQNPLETTQWTNRSLDQRGSLGPSTHRSWGGPVPILSFPDHSTVETISSGWLPSIGSKEATPRAATFSSRCLPHLLPTPRASTNDRSTPRNTPRQEAVSRASTDGVCSRSFTPNFHRANISSVHIPQPPSFVQGTAPVENRASSKQSDASPSRVNLDQVPMTLRSSFDKVPMMSMSSFDKVPMTLRSSFDKVPMMSKSSFDKVPMMSRSSFDKVPMMSRSIFDKVPMTSRPAIERVQMTSRSILDNVPMTSSSNFDNVLNLSRPIDNVPMTSRASFDKVPMTSRNEHFPFSSTSQPCSLGDAMSPNLEEKSFGLQTCPSGELQNFCQQRRMCTGPLRDTYRPTSDPQCADTGQFFSNQFSSHPTLSLRQSLRTGSGTASQNQSLTRQLASTSNSRSSSSRNTYCFSELSLGRAAMQSHDASSVEVHPPLAQMSFAFDPVIRREGSKEGNMSILSTIESLNRSKATSPAHSKEHSPFAITSPVYIPESAFQQSEQPSAPYHQFQQTSCQSAPYLQSQQPSAPYQNSQQTSAPYQQSQQKSYQTVPYQQPQQIPVTYQQLLQPSAPYQQSQQPSAPYQKSRQTSAPYENSKQTSAPYQTSQQSSAPYQNSQQTSAPYQQPQQKSYQTVPYQQPQQTPAIYQQLLQPSATYQQTQQPSAPYQQSQQTSAPCRLSQQTAAPPHQPVSALQQSVQASAVSAPYQQSQQTPAPYQSLYQPSAPYQQPFEPPAPYQQPYQKSLEASALYQQPFEPSAPHQQSRQTPAPSPAPCPEVVDVPIITVVSQRVKPIFRQESGETEIVELTRYRPVLHPIDVPVEKPILHKGTKLVSSVPRSVTSSKIEISDAQYNSLLLHLNPNMHPEVQLPFRCDKSGCIPLQHPSLQLGDCAGELHEFDITKYTPAPLECPKKGKTP